MLQAPRSNWQTYSYGAFTNSVWVDAPPSPSPNTEGQDPRQKQLGPQGLGKITRCQILVQNQPLDLEYRGLSCLTGRSKTEGS